MFGQLPDFTNSYEFLRKLWASGSGMPSGLMPGLSAMTPPMDLEGIDKRIHDLKAVESWLQLNSSLLRTTIQGLEVQRATLVALQTFGSALSPDAMQSAMENVARAASAPSAAPHHQYGAAETVSEAQADAENDEPADDDIDAPPESGAEASATSTGPAPVPPNASLWWDLMQQQFNQIASSAAAAANVTPFSNLGGFGASPAGSESATSATSTKSAGDNKSGPAPKGAKTSGTKKAGTKTVAKKSAKSATKPAAKTSGKSAAKKPAARKASAGKSTAKPETPPAPGTPEDTFE
ncbi:PhaM family polyhydroxyalkanoate granule multifunctional regulatory protein [Cupriavidus metallidurans]|uniref:PhaM family polyhydroxyalkanoate granule multifunctional regulatory protein n=1 Tax=Cupriavidus metallidurans TaxID=119219 RepID=UPI003D07FD7D